MSMTLRAFNEMFPTENVVRALREGTLAERCGACRRRGKSEVLMVQDLNEGVLVSSRRRPIQRIPICHWWHGPKASNLVISSSKDVPARKVTASLTGPHGHYAHRIRAMMPARSIPSLPAPSRSTRLTARGCATPEAGECDPPGSTGRGTKRPLVLVAAARGGRDSSGRSNGRVGHRACRA